MSEMLTIPKDEWVNLHNRLKKMAAEKSYSQLIHLLVNRLGAASGIEHVADNIVTTVIESIGGTNVSIYYWIDNDLYFADVYGEKRSCPEIEDPSVKQVFDTHAAVEYGHAFADTKLILPEFTRAFTWVFPLLVGPDIVGVLKMEDMLIPAHPVHDQLQAFFKYAALVLKNEIQSATRLKQAHDRLEQEVIIRKQTEEELRCARDGLEQQVERRTAELAQANTNLKAEIAERKRAEEEVRILNAELEIRVKQRTAELESTNQELKDFAYIVSHDLKAPLRAISRLIQWLVEDYALAFDAKGREMTDLLLSRVKRLDTLIDGILEYSRIGRIVGQSETIRLHQLLPEIIDSLAPPPTIQIRIEPDLPVLIGDVIRIQQVFANLIGNAMKYMDKPQGIIRIRCEDVGEDWRFSVADNGPGIDPKHHERIFQIFQTLHSHDEVESTGIGLSIVKKIVEFYGGKIWVESEVGQGSTFYFTWPKS